MLYNYFVRSTCALYILLMYVVFHNLKVFVKRIQQWGIAWLNFNVAVTWHNVQSLEWCTDMEHIENSRVQSSAFCIIATYKLRGWIYLYRQTRKCECAHQCVDWGYLCVVGFGIISIFCELVWILKYFDHRHVSSL